MQLQKHTGNSQGSGQRSAARVLGMQRGYGATGNGVAAGGKYQFLG